MKNTNWIEMYFSELWITYMNDTIVKEKFGNCLKAAKTTKYNFGAHINKILVRQGCIN